jgi:hypothetical protein
MRVDPASGDTSWTYGVALCLASGTTPATLDAVAPVSTVGTGFRLLGVGVRTFRFTPSHHPIISVSPWPPPPGVVPDEIHPIRGYSVSTPCQHVAGMDYTELLVGLGRVGTTGGGWHGIAIDYHVGGDRRVLVLDHDLQICGTSVSCDIPKGSDSPS